MAPFSGHRVDLRWLCSKFIVWTSRRTHQANCSTWTTKVVNKIHAAWKLIITQSSWACSNRHWVYMFGIWRRLVMRDRGRSLRHLHGFLVRLWMRLFVRNWLQTYGCSKGLHNVNYWSLVFRQNTVHLLKLFVLEITVRSSTYRVCCWCMLLMRACTGSRLSHLL